MKNRMIELERFFASCVILLYHLGVIKSGWIFVEFFFILSGYFLISHLESHQKAIEADATWYSLKYTCKKYRKMFPYTAISIAAMWVFYAIAWDLSVAGILKWLLYLPCELLLLGGSGMLPYGQVFWGNAATPIMINPLLWYVSSLLTVMPIVFSLLQNKKQLRGLLCTVVPALLYGILIMKDGTVNGWHDNKFGFVYCNVRAAAGLLLGAGVWHLSHWWQSRTITIFGKVILTSIEVLAFLFVAVISSLSNTSYDCLKIALFALSVSLTFSGVTLTASIPYKFCDLLGSWSLAIYCLHKPIMNFFSGHFGDHYPLAISLITIASSAFYTWLITRIQKRTKATAIPL